MRPDVAAAFDRMAAAAREAGLFLSINSAFRSDAEQATRLFAANPNPREVRRGGAWGAPQWRRGSWGGCEFPGRRFRADAGGGARAWCRARARDTGRRRPGGAGPGHGAGGRGDRP